MLKLRDLMVMMNPCQQLAASVLDFMREHSVVEVL
jgi:hypothetical protein